MNRSCLLSIAVFTASASAVLAHITLEKEEAPAESFYKAVLRVPHGCEGSATVKVRLATGNVEGKVREKLQLLTSFRLYGGSP